METELGPVSTAVWDDRRASFRVVESVVRAGCSRLRLNTINNSTCNILYYLRAQRCQWEFCLNSRQRTGPYSLSCLMKYHSPTCAAEADNEAGEIRGSWGGEQCSKAVPLPPSCWGAALPPTGDFPSMLGLSGRCSMDSIVWARETTQPGPGNYGLTP